MKLNVFLLEIHSAQHVNFFMSCLNEVATNFIDSVIVGNTWTVSIMSSTVSLYLTAKTAS